VEEEKNKMKTRSRYITIYSGVGISTYGFGCMNQATNMRGTAGHGRGSLDFGSITA
jgi:hypothetical protein